MLRLPKLFTQKRVPKTKTPRLQHVFVFIPSNAEPRFVVETTFTGIWRREDRACETDADVNKLAQTLFDRYVWKNFEQPIEVTVGEDFPNRTAQFWVERYVPVFIILSKDQELGNSHELKALAATEFGKIIANTLIPDKDRPATQLAQRLAAE